MKRLISYLLLIAAFASPHLRAQEGLTDLRNVEDHIPRSKNRAMHDGSQRIEVIKHKFIYTIDTLNLPFFDDFASNRIKTYDASIDDPNISLKINFDFSVNGATPAKLEYLTDTTYSVLKPVSGETIQSPNPTLYITLYENGKIVDHDTGWTNIITHFNQGTGLVSFDTLLAERVLTNTPDTFYKVADNSSLWTWPIDTFDSLRSVPYINNRFAKNPLTQGVATFDGTNAAGFPYDISSETSHGLADVLTSKPIALDSNMMDVYLSFFYQAGGYGNYPDDGDSLVVDFFDVKDSTWRFAYKINPPENPDTFFARQVFIPVEGNKYLHPGFRFRFKNYATLSGSFDHWHLEYVRLDQSRDTNADDSVINDLAFLKGIQSFIEPYNSVPYHHYNAAPDDFDSDLVSFSAVNLSLDTVNMVGLRYEVYDSQGNPVYSEITADPAIYPRTINTTIFPLPASPFYPQTGNTYEDFTIRCLYAATGIANTYFTNDTILNIQHLHDYYAYDDGTAEQAYGLTGAGVELAYKFNTPVSDSLRAVYFNFPQTLHNNNEDLGIKLMVWTDLDAPPIYEAQLWVVPRYTNANEFFRINLEQAVEVSGTYYVGFRQLEAEKVYIGFDVNRNHSEMISYRIGEDWFETSYKGSLLMRPAFSKESLMYADSPNPEAPQLILYPNPASALVNLQFNGDIATTTVTDIAGRTVASIPGGLSTLSLEGFLPGIYLVRITDSSANIYTAKLVVNH